MKRTITVILNEVPTTRRDAVKNLMIVSTNSKLIPACAEMPVEQTKTKRGHCEEGRPMELSDPAHTPNPYQLLLMASLINKRGAFAQ